MEAYKKVMIVWMLLAIGNAIYANGLTICKMTRQGREACEPYVSGEKYAAFKIPSDACCHATAKADLQCLCGYKDSGLLDYYGIDPDQAMDLPVKCKLVESFNC